MSETRTKQCLEEFARGLRSQSSLESCLNGKVRMHFWDTNERSTDLLTRLPRVTFTRRDIDAQLQRFLAKGITARELSDWAGAMRLLGCFILEEDDSRSSDVWDLIDEVMSPDVWGEITTESVIELRRRLDSLH